MGAAPTENAMKALTLSLGIVSAAISWPAAAQLFPARPIQFVVPYPPGGTSEVIARVLAKKMGESMGTSIIIENISGASGTIGAANVARAAPDGYTLLFGYSPIFNAAPALMPKLAYDPIKSFEPIGTVAQFYQMTTAHHAEPFNTVPVLVTYAKANPGKLTYGSPGVGSTSNLMTELLKLKQGIDIVHVPYRGGGPAITDLIAGRLAVYSDAIGALLPRVEDKTIKPLAVTSAKRLPALPQVPTYIEIGMPELNVATWAALFAPAGTPKEITEKLESELTKALNDGELRRIFADNYYEPVPDTPAEVTARAKAELSKWTSVVKDTGMKVE
jgi:tripartite-type tricarboxylate transporter receptor subunit TctC